MATTPGDSEQRTYVDPDDDSYIEEGSQDALFYWYSGYQATVALEIRLGREFWKTHVYVPERTRRGDLKDRLREINREIFGRETLEPLPSLREIVFDSTESGTTVTLGSIPGVLGSFDDDSYSSRACGSLSCCQAPIPQ